MFIVEVFALWFIGFRSVGGLLCAGGCGADLGLLVCLAYWLAGFWFLVGCDIAF